MYTQIMALRLLISWLIMVQLASAVPGASLVCGGNTCYPVLVGPLLKDIAKDFCSYYLHYPRTTTVVVKTTSTLTSTNTLPAKTTSVTATSSTVAQTTITSTATVAGSIITSTVTETTTVAPLRKREPSPLWTPPQGSPSGYVPPALKPFPSPVISAACSCLVPPSTTTITSTSKATITTTQNVTPTPVTKTVATITTTNTITVTQPAIVTAPPSTATVTTTTTVISGPLQTCNGTPGLPQFAVRGVGDSPTYDAFVYNFPSRIVDARQCYTYCRDYVDDFYGDPPPRSYIWLPDSRDGSEAGPGRCRCYTTQLCAFYIPNPVGDAFAGDVDDGVPYKAGDNGS